MEMRRIVRTRETKTMRGRSRFCDRRGRNERCRRECDHEAALDNRSRFRARRMAHPLAAFVRRADAAPAALAVRTTRHRTGPKFQPGAVDPCNRKQNDGGGAANQR